MTIQAGSLYQVSTDSNLERSTVSNPLRVGCLYRVSTQKQVDHDDQNQAAIPVQQAACRDFAQGMGWNIVFEEIEAGVSGYKVSASNRDKIQLLKEYAEEGKFDILLVFMFDRIGRRAEETPFVVEWFLQHGIQVWSVNEGEQRMENHVDKLMNYIRFWQADGESYKTSLRTKAALGLIVQEGRFRGGVAPYGYSLKPSGIYNKRKHEVQQLEINEDEAKVVRMMFNLCINAGYGRKKIGSVLDSMDIKPREGQSWHEATIGHILHNIAYTGVLRSGESQSDIFPELQIVDPDTFQAAQDLMEQRVKEYHENRTMPLNTRGKSLLSGNIFCGHCKGRLTLTSNGTVRVNAAGERIGRKRLRYVCYNKTRKRCDCTGPTGYTMHIVDSLVTDVLHQIFDKMRSADETEILNRANKCAASDISSRLQNAKSDFAKATKEYESLKAEVIKAVQGESQFPIDLLSELVNTAREKMTGASERLAALNAELENSTKRAKKFQDDYRQLLEWASIFDTSDMAVKKMIAGYIIKRVYVYEGYKMEFELNMNYEQFNLGIDVNSR